MRKLLFLLTAAALSAACHNRSDEEVGAAPDEGRTDTTGVTHAIDSTRTGPPGMQGRPGNATITPDSVGVDSAAVQGADNTTGQDTSVTSSPQDTLGPRDPNSPAYPGGDTLQTDTTTMQHDGMQHDTTTTDTTSSSQ